MSLVGFVGGVCDVNVLRVVGGGVAWRCVLGLRSLCALVEGLCWSPGLSGLTAYVFVGWNCTRQFGISLGGADGVGPGVFWVWLARWVVGGMWATFCLKGSFECSILVPEV